MPKKQKETGKKYRIGHHPFKVAVNEWLASLTNTLNDDDNENDSWALLLESETALTMQTLTKSPSCTQHVNNIQSVQTPSKHNSVFKEKHVVIPQPNLEDLNEIKKSYPSAQIFPLNSHQLLAELSSNKISENERKDHHASILVKVSIPRNGSDEGYISVETTSNRCTTPLTTRPDFSIRESLVSQGWPGWFGLVWLDYCGKISSGGAARRRKLDLELLFKSGMLSSREKPLSNINMTTSKQDRPGPSILAVTMSIRATPQRYRL